MDTRGVILFNRGEKCILRAMVCLYTLRQHWDGPVTFFLEDPYPHEFDNVCKYFNVDIVHNDPNPNLKTLVRKTDMFGSPPYDRTLWLDADMVVLGKLDEMFDYLDEADVAIPHFAGWVSTGRAISKRIKRFNGIAEERHITKALEEHSAVNTGILSFRKSDKWMDFVKYWVGLADKGSKARIFIPDEVAFQILYPSMEEEWDLKVKIAPRDFNVSVLHDHDKSKDRRVIHYHGQKHVLDHPNCDIWKDTFEEMCANDIAEINKFLPYADKRLKQYMKKKNNPCIETTIVTACDPHYVEILRHTFPNWRKYKKIDKYPVIVFVNDIPLDDKRLDFLRDHPNMRLIEWHMDNIDDHREEMLSAFVFGTAENVQTEYWLKLDADSYATNDKPFITEKMKQYAFCGHKWGYSRPKHIKALDEWAKNHWKGKLNKAKPMLTHGGHIDDDKPNRFFHDTKRTISFIQLHKTRFTKFCVSLLKERRLPAPTQDTFMFYVQNRFNPENVGTMNFKRHHGFTQGRGKDPQSIIDKLQEVEDDNK